MAPLTRDGDGAADLLDKSPGQQAIHLGANGRELHTHAMCHLGLPQGPHSSEHGKQDDLRSAQNPFRHGTRDGHVEGNEVGASPRSWNLGEHRLPRIAKVVLQKDHRRLKQVAFPFGLSHKQGLEARCGNILPRIESLE